jgi:hypothetical protein
MLVVAKKLDALPQKWEECATRSRWSAHLRECSKSFCTAEVLDIIQCLRELRKLDGRKVGSDLEQMLDGQGEKSCGIHRAF